MSEFKGTPGPWSVHQYYSDAACVTDSDGMTIVTAEKVGILLGWPDKGFEHWGDEGAHRDISQDEQAANAKLIAASPELLEACQRARNQFCAAGYEPKAGSMNPTECLLLAQLIAAISKATGE